jgi:hypothetical protein
MGRTVAASCTTSAAASVLAPLPPGVNSKVSSREGWRENKRVSECVRERERELMQPKVLTVHTRLRGPRECPKRCHGQRSLARAVGRARHRIVVGACHHHHPSPIQRVPMSVHHVPQWQWCQPLKTKLRDPKPGCARAVSWSNTSPSDIPNWGRTAWRRQQLGAGNNLARKHTSYIVEGPTLPSVSRQSFCEDATASHGARSQRRPTTKWAFHRATAAEAHAPRVLKE